MVQRRSVLVLLVCGLAVAAGRLVNVHAEPPAANPVADFTLNDTEGRPVSLADFRTRKAVVVVFLGTECPINNAFLPRLNELARDYACVSVQFLAVNSNRQDTPERVREHARRYGISFPVLKDEGHAVADRLGARRTPEVVVLDAQRRVCYQGRIDDQFGVGYKRAQPTRRDLVEALNEILAGKAVSVPTTPVAGCLIGRAAKPSADGAVTFTNQVVRILQKNCQECHRPGQIGPMPLLTYDDALSWSETIREVLTDGRMPPWHADPRYGHWANDRRLPADDRATLLAWLDQGCPKGDDKDLPPPRQFVKGWRIGEPDVVFTMPEEFAVPAETPKGGVPYQHFSVKTNFAEDRWVVRAEAKEGATEVVHHIVVFIVPPGLKFIPKAGNAPVLCGTAPGDMPLILPPGMAKKVPAGSELVFQMHYTPNGRAQKDRSSVGLVFAKEPPTHRVHTMPIATMPGTLRIPAGADNHRTESAFTLARDGLLVAFMPHMHLRGKDFLYEAIYPDGKTETLLSIPRYDFNWQSAYRCAAPLAVPKGTRIHCVAHFDNSAKNPNNPDPTQLVKWGDQTWEEMMIGWLDFVYTDKAQ
jgi:peroxiredoxin/mono/diheme cytochrome c family protein